jgi:hypothetical protein
MWLTLPQVVRDRPIPIKSKGITCAQTCGRVFCPKTEMHLALLKRFDFYLLLCYHIPRFEKGLEMTGKPRDEVIELNFFRREEYFAYYYAYATASGKLLHARKTPLP